MYICFSEKNDFVDLEDSSWLHFIAGAEEDDDDDEDNAKSKTALKGTKKGKK